MTHFQVTSNLPIEEEYTEKMNKLSVKLSYYIRWISVLQSVKEYKQHLLCGSYTRFYLKNMWDNERYNDIDDVLNYGMYLEISDPNTKNDVQFKHLWSIHSRSESFSQYYKILNSHYRVLCGVIDQSIRGQFINRLPPTTKDIIDDCSTIEPNVCVQLHENYKPVSEVYKSNVIKFCPSTMKWKNHTNRNKVSKYPEFLIIPSITLQGSIQDYSEQDLQNIYDCYVDIVEQYKNKIITLTDEVIDRQPPPPPMFVHQDETKFDDCCVCYETTNYYTNCNHTLCLECSKKLPRKFCPICRNDLTLPRQVQVETFNGETKEVEQEQKEEIILQEEKQEVQEEVKEEVQQELYNIEEQDLFNTYLYNQQEMTINNSQYKIYYFNIDITDNQLTRLFPNIIRNPKIVVNVNERFKWIEVTIKIN
jgi:hypothetical protein